MNKVKEFVVKYKATIVAVMSAFLTFVISLSQIDMGAKFGIIISILLVVLPVVISILKDDNIETTIKLLVNAITVIQTIIKENHTNVQQEDVVVGVQVDKFTEEEIRELIVKGL